ncbi:S-adenosyl-L-methionine-dependent methyltransferase [Coniella lustricola]|uniref:S-adenosyl-L-methionine-dependent methyltransferase n=1 Tax=Coniella lustricola TaxID=2025994 RepID=A0A2T2ZZ44_9PEZI|nr:S-adenosyl-L-methionine-dependent methyltransferase [Coniella lustricola]
MTSLSNARFNAEAAAWDANPDVHRASASALDAILAAFPDLFGASKPSPDRTIDVLEIGCGTGLLSLRLAPYVSSLVAVDAAEGMIDALQMKLQGGAGVPGGGDSHNSEDNIGGKSEEETQKENEMLRQTVHPLCIMLEDPEDPRLPPAATTASESEKNRESGQGPRKKFDLVISHLTLHHIPGSAFSSLLRTMHGCLKPATGWVALTDYEDLVTDLVDSSIPPSSASPLSSCPPATGTTIPPHKDTTKFHPQAKLTGVEHPRGIHAPSFAALMRGDGEDWAGFRDVDVRPAWTMKKDVERWPGEWGSEGKKPADKEVASMDFPFLLCRGRRGA